MKAFITAISPHPPKILEELIKCTQTIRGYHPHIHETNTNHTPPIDTNTYNHQFTTLKIITWNTRCISSSFPGIQVLTQTLHTNHHIILIYKTKIQKLKSATYINLKNYKTVELYTTTPITKPIILTICRTYHDERRHTSHDTPNYLHK